MIAARSGFAGLVLVAAFARAGVCAPSDALPGRHVGACAAAFGRPVALGLYRGEPIAFAAAAVIEPFDVGVSGDTKPLPKICHTIANVTGVAIAEGPTFYVAEPRQVDRVVALSDGGSYVPSSFVPPLGPDDRIEAIAVNAAGQIEVVTSTNGELAAPRFSLFDRLAAGAHAMPLRAFASSRVTARVSAVAFDARGELYAYDDGGAITEFRSNATGVDPEPVRAIAGPLTLLRPALPAPLPARPLAIDADGTIVAGDARLVLTFAQDAAGDAPPVDVIASPDVGLVSGLGLDVHGFLYVLTDRSIRIFASRADRARGGAAADPIRDDAL